MVWFLEDKQTKKNRYGDLLDYSLQRLLLKSLATRNLHLNYNG